jgi:hypothetical protein
MVRERLGGGSSGIVRDCGCLTAEPKACGHSDHHEGRAWDWAVHVDKPEELELAGQFFDWVHATDEYGNPDANARRAGITYMIYHLKPPNWEPPPAGSTGWGWNSVSKIWKPYRGHPHHDHVHISFGWPGARGETSLYGLLSGELPGPGPGNGAQPLPVKDPTSLLLVLGTGALVAAAGYVLVKRVRA